MYISQIELRDWKVYESVDFQFPAPSSNANIVLIGAENGGGKTSLFEAIVLGVFGQEGLHLIASSPLSGNDNEPLTISYKEYLERTLHRGAISAGRNSCSVKIVFVDDEKVMEIRRTWHFSNSGVYRPKDEVVEVFEGPERKAVGPDKYRQGERLEWYRNYIAHTFLPRYLATFFLFDGEHVSTFAERTMAGQVRTGIEGLLGVPVLRTLADDLRRYATYQRQKTPNISDTTIEKLEKERDELKAKLDKLMQRLDTITPELAKSKETRDNLLRELASLGGASQAKLEEQIKEMHKCESATAEGNKKLEELLSQGIALALAGINLREKLKIRLHSEQILEKWESGKQVGDKRIDAFLDTVKQGMNDVVPQLSESQIDDVSKIARNAWDALWYPKPDGCADFFLHKNLSDIERSKVIDLLNRLDNLGSSQIVTLLNSISDNENKAKRLQESIARLEEVAPTMDEKHKHLEKLNKRIEVCTEEDGALRRERISLDSLIGNKNTELSKLYGQRDLAQRPARLASHALSVADMVDKIVNGAVPNQIQEIAKAMTDAHKSIAHKDGGVERIEIDEDCNVKLLNVNNVDVRDHDLSAGEKQIFTQALISAVSSVSNRAFPMVVDTPLGKLDEEHRKGVLRHLVERRHQVILLSTDSEVVDSYLQGIASHVQIKYLVRHEATGEIGRSIVEQGYFDQKETPK